MNHENDNPASASHITIRNYVTGFILAVVLTLISFGLVTTGIVSGTTAIVLIVIAAVVQMFVHLHYFLHLNKSREMRWNVIAISFTGLMLVIFIAGTLWVMFTLNSRMM